MGIFIEINLENDQLSPQFRERLVDVCPVDIFKMEDQLVVARPEQVDECTLCELCLDVAPAGALTIRKLYSGQQLVSRSSTG